MITTAFSGKGYFYPDNEPDNEKEKKING